MDFFSCQFLTDDKQGGKTHESSFEETQLGNSLPCWHTGYSVEKFPIIITRVVYKQKKKPSQGPYFHQNQIISYK